MATVISVKNLKKQFKTYKREAGTFEAVKSLVLRDYRIKKALKNVSIEVKEGEILGLIGPNGAGKSTLIKILTGVLYPDSGKVMCMGFNPWEERVKYVKNIGVIFGPRKSQLWWDLPAIDTFFFVKELYEVPSKAFGKRMAHFIKILDVAEVVKRPVRDLSLGERMKCELIAALLHNPKIVFLDEPTIGVDLISKDRIREFIKKVNREQKTTFIITTHDMSDIEKLCKRVAIINHGKIVYDGLLSKIKDKYIKTKILHIKLKEKGKIPKLKGCQLEKISDYEFKIEVDLKKQKIPEVTEKLLKQLKIIDVTISNPEIDEIIKEIYRK